MNCQMSCPGQATGDRCLCLVLELVHLRLIIENLYTATGAELQRISDMKIPDLERELATNSHFQELFIQEVEYFSINFGPVN